MRLLLLLAHSQRIRRNYAHTRQRHIHIDTAAWRPLHLPFMHDHVNNFASRTPRVLLDSPLLTFPVAFFLVAASRRGRGESTRAFGCLQKTFSIRFFANCSARSLSLSVCSSFFPTYDEYAYVLTARCSYAPRYAFGPASSLFRLPQSQMNILKKKKTPSLPRRNLLSAFAYFVGNFRLAASLHLCIRFDSNNDVPCTLLTQRSKFPRFIRVISFNWFRQCVFIFYHCSLTFLNLFQIL